MHTAEIDSAFFKAGVSELKTYLLSEQLFWPLGGAPHSGGLALPSLTLGGLLLSQARLGTLLPVGRQGEFPSLVQEMETVKIRWAAAWARKASWEFSSRLKQWQNYLEDYRRNPEAQADYYPQEVKLRAMLTLLTEEISTEDDQAAVTLQGLDRLLKNAFREGDFIWDLALESGFSRDNFWYLYGRLKA